MASPSVSPREKGTPLPAEFAALAAQLPPPLHRLLVENVPPEQIALPELLAALGDGGRRDEPPSLRLLRVMRRRGLRPNAFSYAAAIDAQRRGGHWRTAVALVDRMRVEDVPMDSHSWLALLRVCAAGRQWERSGHIVQAVACAPANATAAASLCRDCAEAAP